MHWAVCVVCVVRDADGWVGVQAKRSVVAVALCVVVLVIVVDS